MIDHLQGYESLLLHCDGADNSTTFTDETGKTVTANGNVKISTTQSKFNGSSAYFDGTGDYLTVPSSPTFGFGTGDFTIDAWIYMTGGNNTDRGITDFRSAIPGANNGTFFVDGAGNRLAFWDGTTKWGSTGAVLGLNSWYHVALSRQSGTLRAFVNGVSDFSVTMTTDLGSNKPLGIGGSYAPTVGSSPFMGYIDELRIVRGVALYTQAFSVPTVPYVYTNYVSALMKFEGTNGSNSFIDEMGRGFAIYGNPITATTQFKKGTSSGYFNGASGILYTPHTALSVGAGDFTVDFWVWTDPSTAAWSRIAENELFNVTGGWHFSYNGSDSAGLRRLGFQLGLNGGGGARIDSNSAIPTSRWVHIAVVRYGTTIAMYVNGAKQTATITSSENFTSQKLMLGTTFTFDNYFTGYLDEFRVTKGIARYTANFNVGFDDHYQPYNSSLIHFNDVNNSTAFVDELCRAITPSGDAKISTTQSKFGGSSAYFDGTGDYLTLSTSGPILTEKFTIEGWVYLSSYSSDSSWGRYFYSQYNQTQDFTNRFLIGMPESSSGSFNKMQCFHSPTGSIVSTTTIALNTWYHVAVTYDGTTRRLFINGVLEASVAHSGTLASTTPLIGCVSYGSAVGFWQGYIDEFRVTKGVARYTANFNPIIESFPYLVLEHYQPYTTLNLHFDGINNSTIFIDETCKEITAYGDAKLSTTQYKFGESACYFDGTGDYLTATVPGAGTGNFTIEMWVYPTVNTAAYKTLIMFPGESTGLYQFNDTFLWWEDSAIRCVSTSLLMNSWYHLAVVRSGNTIDLYVNGVKAGSSYTTSKTYIEEMVYIGRNSLGSEPFTGYIDEVRVTKGIARYTANFSPTISDHYQNSIIFLLHCDGANNSTTFIEETSKIVTAAGSAKISTTQSKFGGSSGWFGATHADYLTTPNSDQWDLASGNFTIEGWFYVITISSVGANLIGRWGAGPSTNTDFIVALNNTYKLEFTSTSTTITTNFTITQNVWHHIAVIRDGNTINIYVDGVLRGTGTKTGAITYAAAQAIRLGIWDDPVSYCNMFFDDIRVTKGVARYTANFNPNLLDAFTYVLIERAYILYQNIRLTSAPNPLSGNLTLKVYDDFVVSSSYYDGGTMRLDGTVTYNGVPASRKVSLFTLKDKRLIAEMWSDPVTGAYSFDRLKDQEYFVWAEDYVRFYTPVSHITTDQTNIPFSDQTRFDPDDFSGDGKIWGVVTDYTGAFLERRLVLLDDQTYIKVKTTISSSVDGSYEFADLNTSRKFTVVAESTRPTSGYNDIIRARVTPEVV